MQDRYSRPHSLPTRTQPKPKTRSSTHALSALTVLTYRRPRSGFRPDRGRGSCATTVCPTCVDAPADDRGASGTRRPPRSATKRQARSSGPQGRRKRPLTVVAGKQVARPIATTKRASTRSPTGNEDLHSLFDHQFRRAYSELVPYEKDSTFAARLERAGGAFRPQNIASIERVMTDNAFAYRILQRGQDVLRAAPRAKHKFIGPHCPCKPARSSASTAPWRQTGRPPDTSIGTDLRSIASAPGSSTTTRFVAAAHSEPQS